MSADLGDGTGGAAYSVDLVRLRATAAAVEDASRAAREVSEHPGVVRGRAQDGGDDELRDAAALLADRWGWSLEQLAHETGRWAAALWIIADQYAEVERQAASSFAHLRALG